MGKAALIIIVTVMLAVIVFLIRDNNGWSLDDAIAFVGLLGIAAALVAFVPDKINSKCRVHISDCQMYVNGDEIWEFRFRATLMNVGSVDDTLEDVEHKLYKRGLGFFHSTLVSGARKLVEDRGHVLPHPLPAGILPEPNHRLSHLIKHGLLKCDVFKGWVLRCVEWDRHSEVADLIALTGR